MGGLLISVRFHDGRYHGSGEWPPSPARLFQALVAGAASGKSLSEHAVRALEWLESLDVPAIAVPLAHSGQTVKNFVPNNDLDAVGGDLARINKIRAGKIVRPRMFHTAVPLIYAWTFEPDADSNEQARAVCEIAENLYQLGRGPDMAWATGEVIDEADAEARLRANGTLWRCTQAGGGAMLSCPRPGSLASLSRRFAAMCGRFKTVGTGKKAFQLFAQAPKPNFRQVPYNSPSAYLLFEIRNEDGFAAQRAECAVALTEQVRDLAVGRLKASGWRRDDPKREALADNVFVGRNAQQADKAGRIRVTPLPSIGHAQVEQSIRRMLVTVPPDCPIASEDIAWAFSGLALADPETGQLAEDGAELIRATDRGMLTPYGVEDAAPMRLWRTVTPAALPGRAARRRINPQRMQEEAKGGAERLREHAAAEWAVQQALRHADIGVSVESIRVQREPFEHRGQRAEAFETKPRFAKERLWHVAIRFDEPVAGPLLIGDGRYLGLGLMAPVRQTDGFFAFTITSGLTEQAEPLSLTRALRRAIMARVQDRLKKGEILPGFFTGHAPDGTPLRSGRREHLAFGFDAPRQRLLIVAPHLLERRDAFRDERERHLAVLADALEDFRELRAGAAGKLTLLSKAVDLTCDPLFVPSSQWESVTPYQVTRHARLKDAAAALEADVFLECQRARLPRPQVEVARIFAKPGTGLSGFMKLVFHHAPAGPMLLGRHRHFGGGLFAAAG